MPDQQTLGHVAGSARSSMSTLSHYRWTIASRAVAAIGGGYGLSALFCASAGLALTHLGVSHLNAVMTATMLAFVVHPIAAIWAFRARSTARVWLGMLVMAALFGGSAVLMGWQP